jgi:class 3 adenylate cyclase
MTDTQTVTLLFTDLVGSTALTSALDREAAESLRQTHFGLLQDASTASGGVVVKNLGDGLMVVFTSPTRALACAVAMQQAIDRHNRRHEVPLAIRVGLSIGEVVEEDGDYFGEPVIEAARLCAEADGGQILATEMVRAIVGRHAVHELTPIGERQLKGLPQPVSVVEVGWEPAVPDDASPVGAVPLPAQLVSSLDQSLFAFFGRAMELELVAAAIKEAPGDRRARLCFVGGEPGVGKSALVAQAARAAHAQGAVVLFGSCSEDLVVPYRPWMTALGQLIEHAAPETLAALSPVDAGALARLLPGHGARLPASDVVAGDGDTGRLLLMEAVVALLAHAATDRTVMLVLDDLHWADAATIGLLRHVARSGRPASLVIVATYRHSELTRQDALSALLAELHREPRVQQFVMSGLADREIVDLIEAAAGYQLDEAGIGLAHALHRETNGNPFFVSELLRHLSESGEIAPGSDGRFRLTPDLDQLVLPNSLRDVVAQRVARLGDTALRLLPLAAVIGQTFDVDLLAGLVDLTEDDLLDLLDRAVVAALLIEDRDNPGGYRFAHALIRHTLYQDLSAVRRQRAHARIAQLLEHSRSDRSARGGSAAALAHHWLAATRPADTGKALRWACEAGDEALGALAPGDAIRWYTQALELLEREPTEHRESRCQVLTQLARARLYAGDANYLDTLHEAGRLARQLGDVELLVDVATVRMAGVGSTKSSDAELLLVLEAALDAVGSEDSATRARLLAALCDEIDPREAERVLELAAEALAVARRVGDDDALFEVLIYTGSPRKVPELLDEALVDADDAIRLADARPDLAVRFDARTTFHSQYVQATQLVRADQVAAEATEIARQTGLP